MSIESLLSVQRYLHHAKVFIVDDVLANLDVLRLYLEQGGHEVAFATTGEKALQLIPLWQPHVILLDIMMMPMDGFTVCRQLKSNELTAHIPVIFISAADSQDNIERSFREGGVDYLNKPFARTEILVKVQTQLERVWYRQRSLRLQYDITHCFNALQHSNIGTLQLDVKGTICQWNGKAQQLLRLEGRNLPLSNYEWLKSFQIEDNFDFGQLCEQSVLSQQTFAYSLALKDTQSILQLQMIPSLAEQQELSMLYILLSQ